MKIGESNLAQTKSIGFMDIHYNKVTISPQ